ncbi:hypothetical protein FRC08_007312 [Ceratobasidium sp. 394]|nr:hypothetical protein FRC08_007312 [Ceratobasidium sp. 394]
MDTRGGTLEATMVRGFMKRAGAYGLVHELQSIAHPRADDTNTINCALKVMCNGPEHELQREMLDAILAGEAHFRGQERIALAITSRQVDWTDGDHNPFWDMVMDFCGEQLHGVIVYGYGAAPPGGVRLDPQGSTRCFPYVHHGGLRFGNDFQTRGYSSRYGYIENMVPVLIRRIYQCTLELEEEPEPRTILCAVVQRFTEAARPAEFPWDRLAHRLEVQSWAFGELEDPEIVSVDAFTGVFALGDIELSYGHYWVTFAMKPVEPELFEG